MILNQITLPCTEDDFFTCLEFYQKLGLKLIVHTHDAYARFECPVGDGGGQPATLSLHVVGGKLGASETRAVIYFEVADVRGAVQSLRAAGFSISEAADESWLWTEANLTDPAGNRVKIYKAGENRRFPPWRKDD